MAAKRAVAVATSTQEITSDQPLSASEATSFFTDDSFLQFICTNAAIVTDRISAPQSHYFTLALVRHGSKSCQNKSAAVCEITGKKPTIIRASANSAEGV